MASVPFENILAHLGNKYSFYKQIFGLTFYLLNCCMHSVLNWQQISCWSPDIVKFGFLPLEMNCWA